MVFHLSWIGLATEPTEPSHKHTLTQVPALKYTPPEWSGLPKADYAFEVMKNGVIIDTLPLSRDREFVTIGRLPTCDVALEHPVREYFNYHAAVNH